MLRHTECACYTHSSFGRFTSNVRRAGDTVTISPRMRRKPTIAHCKLRLGPLDEACAKITLNAGIDMSL